MTKTALMVMVCLLVVGAVGQVYAENVDGIISIGNFVFMDSVAQGTRQDPFEVSPADTGIDGVQVALYAGASATGPWTAMGTTVTEGGGYYYFEGLQGDQYFKVVLNTANLAGLQQTYNRSLGDLDGSATNSQTVAYVSKDAQIDMYGWNDPAGPFADYSFDFGYIAAQPCSVGDRVWWDVDGEADQDEVAAANGLNDWTVQLWSAVAGDGGSVPGAMLQQTTTAASAATVPDASGGFYVFENLAAGTYFIKVIPATGWEQTYDRDGHIATPNIAVVTLNAGDNLRDLDFGYKQTTHDDGDEFITVTPGGWGAKPSGGNPAMFLKNAFLNGDISTITIGGTPYSMTFKSQKQIEIFLPQGGTAKALTSSFSPANGTVSPPNIKNVLAGHVLAMSLNIYFYPDAGDLTIATGPFAGTVASELLAKANLYLGGAPLPAGMTYSMLTDACTAYNENFDNGANKGFLVIP